MSKNNNSMHNFPLIIAKSCERVYKRSMIWILILKLARRRVVRSCLVDDIVFADI